MKKSKVPTTLVLGVLAVLWLSLSAAYVAHVKREIRSEYGENRPIKVLAVNCDIPPGKVLRASNLVEVTRLEHSVGPNVVLSSERSLNRVKDKRVLYRLSKGDALRGHHIDTRLLRQVRPYGQPTPEATVLFSGDHTSHWQGEVKDGKDTVRWKLNGRNLEVVNGTGSISTREAVEGDCQWHIKWRATSGINRGIFVTGYPEFQIPSHTNKAYKTTVNRGASDWQTYDIICLREKKKAGKVVQQGSITLLQNGIVIHHALQTDVSQTASRLILRDDGHIIKPVSTETVFGSREQKYNQFLSYREIWVHPLSPETPE